MDIFFRGIGIDCNITDPEALEASVVCPQLGMEKSIHKINETYFSVSIFGQVSSLIN
jgi:hypothetical protein